ncbi:MAG: metal ABC transporter permease [Chloroflexi bacterium]|nr:MAG: metal ABC transporter permease [Chloroflexota bacterium]TME43230.1 MAG: metal ABC transporter permease [Chloroflexota bacterium]TME51623.1 MAG: metal ABC transporter permease [Chloroflexota bacterium]
MQNAFVAGTLVALLAGAAGYFVVLRGQSFAAHMLSQVGFPGAAGAVLVHVAPVFGLVAFCVAAALGIGWVGRNVDAGHRAESAAVGSILAFSLGLGLLFFRLYAGSAAGIYGFLFGTILGISDRDVQLTFVVALLGLGALAIFGRRLVFATVDPDVAEARGVNVRLLSIGFLVIVALSVAITVQIVGTLLIFALLVAPGASALQLTARPVRALALSVLLSLGFTWLGVALAYFSDLPVGFFISTVSFVAYVAIRAVKGASAIRRGNFQLRGAWFAAEA